MAHEVDRVDRDGVDHAEHVVDDMGHGIGARVVGSHTRPLAVRLELHELDGHRILGLLEALWGAAVDYLFARLGADLGDLPLAEGTDDPVELGVAFAEAIRRFVRFAAAHPELNQIMVHEATEDSDRLRWMVERHVRPIYDLIRVVWQRLYDAGITAPVDPTKVHYFIVGGHRSRNAARAGGAAGLVRSRSAGR